jgi:hypothetical protein
MSLLWAVPPVTIVAAAAIVLVQLRDIAEATSDLGVQLRRFDEVQVAVATVRAESAEARASLQSLRTR